ncbi:hypothetical protein PsorP6_000742 [Peronosclerospora sorghi]|uniref:Uncharacterized protein n=1 Tax=Peronosclerospora sorghi TaxID=230839 RepID=A0ACC0WWL7_9STRA|nr:hypothetical protein PsorP6_000742 [Peronosclerospora sorghi]
METDLCTFHTLSNRLMSSIHTLIGSMHNAITCSTRCRTAFKRVAFVPPRPWRFFTSSGENDSWKNPFEIDLNPLQTPQRTSPMVSTEDAKRASALQVASAQEEMNQLHDEMANVFREKVAEYGETTSASGTQFAPNIKHKNREIKTPDVLLVLGPCSFVQDVWIDGEMKKVEFWPWIRARAADLKMKVKSFHYDLESLVVKKILAARANQVIVLYWSSKYTQLLGSYLPYRLTIVWWAFLVSLTKSPFVRQALELTHSKIILVSPSNVEHGPLPSNVIGVLSGFQDQALVLALNAVANLRATIPKQDKNT